MPVKNLLEFIRKNTAFLPVYLQAMSLLNETLVLDYLVEQGKPKPIYPGGDSFVDLQVAEYNKSIGYNQCLYDLINFKERFLEVVVAQNAPMDFGAVARLEEQQDLTKEEADAIRRNSPIPELKSIPINPKPNKS